MKLNPYKLKVLGNRVLIKHLDGDMSKGSTKTETESGIVLVNNSANSNKLMPLGEVINRPDLVKVQSGKRVEAEVAVGDVIGFDRKSVLHKIDYEEETYFIIRVEDIYFVVNN